MAFLQLSPPKPQTRLACLTSSTNSLKQLIFRFINYLTMLKATTYIMFRLLRALHPDLPASTTFTLQTLDGGSNPQSPAQAGIEAVSPYFVALY